jgi:hypothetical protein
MSLLGLLFVGLLGWQLWRNTSSPTARAVLLAMLLLLALSSYLPPETFGGVDSDLEFPLPEIDTPPIR